MKYKVTNTDLAYGDKKNEPAVYPEGSEVDFDPKEKEVARLVTAGILVPVKEEPVEDKGKAGKADSKEK